jgi:signal transduction histidine kinase
MRERIGWGETAELPAVIRESSSSVERIVRIVKNIRRDVHPSGPGLKTELKRVLQQVEVLCRAELQGRADLEVTTNCADARVPLAEDDLVTVLSNLVVNAAHAVEAGKGRIALSATRGDDEVLVLEVADNGEGIPKENLSRVCDPFFTTKAPGKGTGLGLSLASQIVQAARGDLKIDSEVGQGTRVTLRIPLSPLGPTPPAARA